MGATKTGRKGRAGELRVMRWYRENDWLVACRDREEGPGDLTANRLGDKPHLTEVKATKGSPFENFKPAERNALRLCAIAAGMVPMLAWSPSPSRPIQFLGAEDWPGHTSA